MTIFGGSLLKGIGFVNTKKVNTKKVNKSIPIFLFILSSGCISIPAYG